VIKAHDIGLRLHAPSRHACERGYEVIVGGGLGRTPMIGKVVRDFLPKADLLAYLEAIMRVYNLDGRRDNKYKARVKILVHEIGVPRSSRAASRRNSPRLDGPSRQRRSGARSRASPPISRRRPMRRCRRPAATFEAARAKQSRLRPLGRTNIAAAPPPGYAALTISLKPIGAHSGRRHQRPDARRRRSGGALLAVDEIRVTHAPEPRPAACEAATTSSPSGSVLGEAGLATANARADHRHHRLPRPRLLRAGDGAFDPDRAGDLAQRFADPVRRSTRSVCSTSRSPAASMPAATTMSAISAFSASRSAAIESYQITLGGDATENAAIGEILGPGLAAEDVPDAIERIVSVYLAQRQTGESFIDNVRRIGLAPFKAAFQEVSHAVA
jgi:sulfite reductase (NADPH) hemoprotein beta-component